MIRGINDDIENVIKAIGQEIIDRASETATDLKNVSKIKLYSEIKVDSNIAVEISKEYVVNMNKYYDNHVYKKDKNKEE